MGSHSVRLEYAHVGDQRGARWWAWAMVAIVAVVASFWLFDKMMEVSRTNQNRVAAARADVEALRLQLDAFRADTGRYPTAAEGLAALVAPPPGIVGWRGPYVKRSVALDPWGLRYGYVPAAGTSAPRVVSPGPDGQPGTSDDIASGP